MSAEPTSPIATGPSWDTITEEILCPLCDYNLRGLTEPRCPECGYRFAWDELLDPSRRLHPYLFEHHTEQPLWSFWRTLLAGLRPRHFWKALHPAQPSYSRRLVLYWVLAIVPLLLTIPADLGALAIGIRRENQAARKWELRRFRNPRVVALLNSTLQQYDSVAQYLDATYPIDAWSLARLVWGQGKKLAAFLVPVAVFLAWPWLTYIGLSVFQSSIRRARLTRVHVLRCVCYSADTSFWLGLALFPGVLIFACYRPTRLPGLLTDIANFGFVAGAVAVLCFAYRLITAYCLYLRFQHAVWVVVAAQTVAMLLTMTVVRLMVLLGERM